MSKTIVELGKEIDDQATRKGWNDDLDLSIRCFSSQLTNMHSELSEAWEELRNGHSIYEVYFSGGDFKPEGFGIELADLVIRVFHTCFHYNIPIENLIKQKMEYNETRDYRHGGKLA